VHRPDSEVSHWGGERAIRRISAIPSASGSAYPRFYLPTAQTYFLNALYLKVFLHVAAKSVPPEVLTLTYAGNS